MKAPLLFLLLLVVFAPIVRSQTPKTAEEFNNRGLDRQNRGDYDAAIDDFTKGISLKPKPSTLATLYNNRGNAFMSKNNFDAAVSDYSSAIQLQPGDFEN